LGRTTRKEKQRGCIGIETPNVRDGNEVTKEGIILHELVFVFLQQNPTWYLPTVAIVSVLSP